VSPDTAPSPVEMSAVGRGYLVRYRVMAYTTAVLLIVLVFVGLPLQFAAHRPEVVNVVGTVHGFLYLIYLAVAFQLTRRLAVPKGKMALVLLAGTVPFCAFVAERKLTRRFEARGAQADPSPDADGAESRRARTVRVRQRWFSRRALTFHLEVLIIAPACVLAGWWQTTRALAGNGLSWAYSVEWPVFALLAIAGWWKLIHEDPEVYRARKYGAPAGDGAAAGGVVTTEASVTVDAGTARLAKRLLSLVGVEFVLGIVALIFVPYGRPSGWQPVKGEPILLAHSVLGLPLAVGAAVLLARVWRSSRIPRLCGWIGAVGVAVAGSGGLLTVAHSWRLVGMALMLVGPVVAAFGYLFPTLEKSAT
jgi:integral membrane protein